MPLSFICCKISSKYQPFLPAKTKKYSSLSSFLNLVNASIIVGAENDNNSPASAIQNWDLQNAYIVLRAYNTEGFVKYSDHYNIQVNDTLQ